MHPIQDKASCSPSMSKVIQLLGGDIVPLLEGDIETTTLLFQLTRLCSSMALTNCFGDSNDRSNKYETAKTPN